MKFRVIVSECCVYVGCDCCVSVDCDCDVLEFSFDRFSCAAEFIKLCLKQGFFVEVRTNEEEVE